MSYKEILEEIDKLSLSERKDLSKHLDEKIFSSLYPNLEKRYNEVKENIKNGTAYIGTSQELFDELENENNL